MAKKRQEINAPPKSFHVPADIVGLSSALITSMRREYDRRMSTDSKQAASRRAQSLHGCKHPAKKKK